MQLKGALNRFLGSFTPAMFLIVLAGPAGTAIAQTLVIDDASVFEGNAGEKILVLPVRFVGAQPNTVTGVVSAIPLSGAFFNPATGGAQCGGNIDFEQFNNVPFTIPPNTPNGTLSVNISVCGNTVVEPDEHIFVSLTSVVGAQCLEGTCNAVGTIRDDDGPPRISINDIATLEPFSGSRDVSFTLRLEYPISTPASIHFRTRNGTATSTGFFPDYVRVIDALVPIPAFATSVPATVRILTDGNLFNEGEETFFVDLFTPSTNIELGDAVGRGTIINATLLTGVFDLGLDKNPVQVDEIVTFTVVWTVPEGEVWRDLETIDFRVGRGRNALWIRWDEAGNTFSVCGKGGHGGRPENDDDGGDDGDDRDSDDDDGDDEPGSEVVCTPGELPGSPVVLETRRARLHLAESSVVGSGPTGRSVTLTLPVSFNRRAAGHSYRLALAASDDLGHEDEFVRAGQLQIERRRGADGDEDDDG